MVVRNKVIELPNRSKRPHDSFLVSTNDISIAMVNNDMPVQVWENPDDIIFWHTHPSGGVGPSRADMYTRRQLQPIRHLVVALTDEGAIPAWY